MPETLIFTCDGVPHEIALTDEFAPRTLAGLKEILPTRITIHCAKIAGCHIYWHSPVLALLEKGADIHSLPPGAFLYYPDRQYFEITYDALQAETASVNLVGHFKGDLGWLRDFAERHRRESGGPVTYATLELADAPPAAGPARPEGDTPWDRLRRARADVWDTEPADVRKLLRRDGLNIPFGPLMTAESYMRVTHELLWRLWANKSGLDAAERRAAAINALELAVARVAGYCQMEETGARLGDAITCLSDPALPVEDVLAETLRYCARMAGWLDLQVPWWRANELAKESLSHVRD